MPTYGNTDPLTDAGKVINPTVWADDYGTWHAAVPLSTPARQAHQARALIMAELLARAPRGVTARDIRLRITKERLSSVPGRVIYGEKWN